tara:strand:- start:430 stop:759 length:330 start_codon:yes stop_codon:yes gene_type:complete
MSDMKQANLETEVKVICASCGTVEQFKAAEVDAFPSLTEMTRFELSHFKEGWCNSRGKYFCSDKKCFLLEKAKVYLTKQDCDSPYYYATRYVRPLSPKAVDAVLDKLKE